MRRLRRYVVPQLLLERLENKSKLISLALDITNINRNIVLFEENTMKEQAIRYTNHPLINLSPRIYDNEILLELAYREWPEIITLEAIWKGRLDVLLKRRRVSKKIIKMSYTELIEEIGLELAKNSQLLSLLRMPFEKAVYPDGIREHFTKIWGEYHVNKTVQKQRRRNINMYLGIFFTLCSFTLIAHQIYTFI